MGFTIGIFTTIWFLWGGIKDLFALFHTLNVAERDAMDDGMVQKQDRESAEVIAPAAQDT